MKHYAKITKWLLVHEKHLLVAFVMTIAIFGSFLFGIYNGRASSQPPMTIIRAHENTTATPQQCTDTSAETILPADCQFVGSAKGTKYYPPNCTYAQKIAKENLRCFTSAEDAEKQGYTRSSSCQ